MRAVGPCAKSMGKFSKVIVQVLLLMPRSVTNWTFSFEGHKGCGDWQAAMGITFRVHHLTWATMAGEAKRDFPACMYVNSLFLPPLLQVGFSAHSTHIFSAHTILLGF